MNLKKQKIGYWVSTLLLNIGIIMLVQSGWESRGYWLHPLLELGLTWIPTAGDRDWNSHTAVPVPLEIPRNLFLCRKKRILPLLRDRI